MRLLQAVGGMVDVAMNMIGVTNSIVVLLLVGSVYVNQEKDNDEIFLQNKMY
jgi:hypothetical protein